MSKPLIFKSIAEFNAFRKNTQGSVGLVTTMGALHQGHASLFRQSVKENDVTIITIFVNPAQFNDPKDLAKYPRTLEADYEIAAQCGVDAVFQPDEKEIYFDAYCYRVIENNFSKTLCGAHREGHFDGVLTVLMKLFNIIQPHKAYYGEKDFQQLCLVQQMIKAFFMPIEICAGKTLREPSGLAMSSRNRHLTPEGREKAALIYKTIKEAKSVVDVKSSLSSAGFKIDYVEDIDNRRFVAVFLEGIRLIDNAELTI